MLQISLWAVTSGILIQKVSIIFKGMGNGVYRVYSSGGYTGN
jgi:hypothetical protein